MYYQEYQCPFCNYDCYGYRNAAGMQNMQGMQNMHLMSAGKAVAYITGGPLAPNLKGTVTFTAVPGGTEVSVEVNGLPPYKPAAAGSPQVGPHGFHIHESGNCVVGNPAEPFKAAGEHWNPTNQPHGNHAGDFPVLFSNDGFARMTFFTNKLTVDQIIGKSLVI
ncbi:MAG: superoxide dismutase family protein, partial [Bacillota bacterium]|nr:superoxide dismutase family protein [Bacillota bacterium]